MKRSMLKSVVVLTLALGISLQVFAKREELTRTIHKEYIVEPDAMLKVANKFGKVHITTDNSNAIVIDVEIKVEGRNADKAQQIMDRIHIDFNAGPKQVEASTQIGNSGSVTMKNTEDLEINYTITMPQRGSVDIENKFGDVFITEIDGTTNFQVSYGSLVAQKLNSERNTAVVKFGSADITEALYLDLTSKYSGTHVKKVKLLELDSQYGDSEIGAAGRINISSGYDDVEIGAVAELLGTVKFSDLNVKAITQKYDVKNSYGDVDIEFISKDFREVRVNSSFADVDIYFEQGSNFTLDATMKFGDINIPSGAEVRRDEGNTSESITGKLREGQTKSIVVIVGSYGDISLGIK
jgi:hypothetical protein